MLDSLIDVLCRLAHPFRRKTVFISHQRPPFRPALEELESRLVPSASGGGLLDTMSSLGHYDHSPLTSALIAPSVMASPATSHSQLDTSQQNLAAQQQQQAQSVVTIDLKLCTNLEGGFRGPSIKLYFKAQDGTIYDKTFIVPPNTPTKLLRDTLVQDLKTDGWTVTAAGDTAFTVSGHTKDGALSKPVQYGAVAPGLKEGFQPSSIAADGVKRGQQTEGGKWKFTLLPIDPSNPVLTENATVVLTVDDNVLTVQLTQGMNASTATFTVYEAMLAAGFADATFDGSSISFLNDSQGQEALNVQVSWTDNNPSDQMTGGLYAQVDVADRTILS